MNLNAEQSAAVDMMVRAAQNKTVGVVSGPAGTGKTAMLSEALKTLGKQALVITPTGRAALRVKELTGVTAITISRLIHQPVEDEETGECYFKNKGMDSIAGELVGVKLLIADEASMVNIDHRKGLQRVQDKFGVGIVFVGDGHQLPPVDEYHRKFSVFEPGFPSDEQVEFTEVFRQALDSPVIRVATAVRQAGSFAEAMAAIRNGLPRMRGTVAARACDLRTGNVNHVVITHRNATRQNLNRMVRQACGVKSPDPEAGEPILVRKNNYALELMNGEIITFPGYINEGGWSSDGYVWRFADFGGMRTGICPEAIMGRVEEPVPKVVKKLKKWDSIHTGDDSLPYLRANLGYVVTAHSSQGSDWDHVVMIVESSLRVMPEVDRVRWLYTAITRAKKVTEVVFA